jgi:SAM-dependent methyltransferase
MKSPLAAIAHTLVSNPFVYDMVQRAAGSVTCYQHLRAMLPRETSGVVLDAGGGTGRSLAILGARTDYLAVDNDPVKLARLRKKHPSAFAVAGDVTRLPLQSSTVDITLLVFVCHHLDDVALAACLAELARVARGNVLVMDPLWEPRRWRSRTLWRYDVGKFPRTAKALSAAIARDFDVDGEDEFAVHHRYHIWRCRPK